MRGGRNRRSQRSASPSGDRGLAGRPQSNAKRDGGLKGRTTQSVGLWLATGLSPNDQHPLADLSEQRRTEERVRIFAGVLAKLAIQSADISSKGEK